MRFAPEAVWGANAGLGSARDFLEPIKVGSMTDYLIDLLRLRSWLICYIFHKITEKVPFHELR
jgi:hypothetical protein